ncbi:hypothetical protein [Demequina pelophila]|uniref:hypothetical protein n=1 Tax=Demequina pelophila TaxID=1638984 RepID=UPI00078428CC|nr:hypothetical protein [Demequina pelophila]
MDNTRRLDIPGAAGRVEVDGVLGLLYKVKVDDQVILRRKGHWAIPLRKGGTARLTSSGLIPGFQTLRLDGEPVLKMGAHVQPPEKAAAFSPLLLILLGWLGAVIAVLMVLSNIVLVKNANMPRGLRIALPLVNTVVIAGVIYVLFAPYSG